MPPPIHILIVGGGLSGTALAIALAHQGIKSTIHELRPSAGDIGGAIMLAPNALRVLDKTLHIYSEITAAGFTCQDVNIYFDDPVPRLVGKFGLAEGAEDGQYPAIRILRSRLHRILLDKCAEMKGEVSVEYGKRFTKIAEDDTGVTVEFDDGTTATGDILIGADGIHSTVREHVLGPQAPIAKYSGLCSIMTTVSREDLHLPPGFDLPAMIYTRRGTVMCIPFDPMGESVGCTMTKALAEKDGRRGWDEYRASGEAARAIRADYQATGSVVIQSILDRMVDDNVRLWAPYEIPDLPSWQRGRVCLIGDAAHAIPPSGGQGSAQAFEDAAYLARLLGTLTSTEEVGTVKQAFAQWERVRKARFEHIRKVTNESGKSRQGSQGWLGWTGKKMAMRAFFAYKRGVWRDTRITGYDVEQISLDGV